VLADIPMNMVREVVVVNNNSTDATAQQAQNAGATVIDEPRQGYGFACWKGVDYLQSKKPDIVVFIDADYADDPREIVDLIKPILEQNYDLVIGSRTLGKKERKSMPPQQLFGNWLATLLIRMLYGKRFTDLGPFRAIKWNKLINLDMKSRTYGWPVEMQIKAIKQHLRIYEVPVRYRVRIGKSKISGTLKGTVAAGFTIIATILKYR
jgi:glycosyltransferase involved in cell wall biosynthesis